MRQSVGRSKARLGREETNHEIKKCRERQSKSGE